MDEEHRHQREASRTKHLLYVGAETRISRTINNGRDPATASSIFWVRVSCWCWGCSSIPASAISLGFLHRHPQMSIKLKILSVEETDRDCAAMQEWRSTQHLQEDTTREPKKY